ncbi:syntaxin-like t-SNARE protein TLG2 [Amanita rubescens]|nr:syntaxin-like t-SNARE protein TLG2 [Amanita rubescens]
MTTRSRTGLFLSYRHSARPLIIDHHLTLDITPPWTAIADRVNNTIIHTHQKIAALDRLHAKHLLPGFSDRSFEEHEIDTLTTDITRDFRNCHTFIQKIPTAQSHAFPPSHISTHDQLAAKNVQRALAAKVQDLSATFRKKQRVYMEKLQGHAIKNQDLLVASGAVSLRGTDGLDAVDDDIQAASLAYADPSLDFRARNHQLTEIANNIAALAELFKDLSALVIDQGTLLDSVEYNIEQTAVHIQESVMELEMATRYQKNTGRRKCIFLLLLIIFGLIIVLIFKPKRHAFPPPPPPPPSS